MNTPPMQPPPMPAPPMRAPGPRLLISFIVMGAGFLIGLVAVVAIALPFANTLTSKEYPVPGTITLNLHEARYTVYQFTGTRSLFGGESNSGAYRIAPSAVTVTAPDGSTVPVSYTTRDEVLTRGSRQYQGALDFDAPAKGHYVIVFDRSAPSTFVVVSRSVEDVLRSVVGWFALGALGGVVLVAGVIMLIVGIVRRGRAKRMMYAGWGAPPQWGPGPPPQQWGPGPQQQQWGPAPQSPQWGPPPQQQWTPPGQWTPPPAQPPPPPPDEPPPATG
jgi:hypothetical protein